MTQTAKPVTLLASPLGEEGHKVAKGWTVVILIMILDVDVTAEGGIIKLIALRAIPQPSGQGPVKLKNPPANGRSILRTFPSKPSEPCEPSEPSEPGPRSGPIASLFSPATKHRDI